MRTRMALCLGLVALLALVPVYVLAAQAPPPAAAAEKQAPPAAPDRLSIAVDPRLELLTTVQLLAGYEVLARGNFAYKREVQTHFAKYKGHSAVKCFAEMRAKGFAFAAPVETVLCLSNPPELMPQREYSDFVIGRAGGRENVERFVGELRRFAQDTRFMEFYAAHKKTYGAFTAAVREKFKGTDDVDLLEKYFGTKQASYTLLFGPLVHGGGFGIRFKNGDGLYDTYDVCGTARVSNGVPEVAPARELRYLTWHEFSHSFVTPPAETFAPYAGLIEVIKRKGYLYGQEEGMKGVSADMLWAECVNEHIVRAVTVRLTLAQYGPEIRDTHMNAEVQSGFIFTPAIAKCLEKYEAQRDKYPAFSDFYDEIAKAFGEIAAQEKVKVQAK